jgi:hypothetical protein
MGLMDVQLYSFLTLALDGGEWSPSSSGRFTAGEKFPFDSELEIGWAIIWESNHDFSVVQIIT